MASMKLRILGNSLRFRLTQTEVVKLRSAEAVRESVSFPGSASKLTYSLETSERLSKISASFHNEEVRVSIPASLARSWVEGDQVGIEENEPLGDGSELRVLIEKDYRCLEPRPGEDEADNFPNPLGSPEQCETTHPLT